METKAIYAHRVGQHGWWDIEDARYNAETNTVKMLGRDGVTWVEYWVPSPAVVFTDLDYSRDTDRAEAFKRLRNA